MRGNRFARSILRLGAIGGVALALTACEGIKDQLGLGKKAPDEFSVVTKAPLVMPPDFTLRPPRPGAEPTQEAQPRQLAREALVGGSRPSVIADRNLSSPGEAALLRKAGATDVDPSIRDVINRETTQLVSKDKGFADTLIFWRKSEPPGSVIDAEKEQARLRENAAVGKTPSEGEVPVIRRKKKALLEGIF
jgi:hypothetical protein